ncbi:TetR/AcrR family transcriptional regulator C-terminal domain-containing protein [Kitasatospora sp. NPDC052896]|uniref:TetR/AcrR family transcriptional regulator C-terminal domain-containing protein n=1 Tax=Kitasatospora sp. NPDC052896 TaxID=3364061 RepID=UPI0037C6CB98
MLDSVVAEYELPAEPSGDVRADLTALAHQQLGILRRHRWALSLVITRPTLGPNGLRFLDHFLAVLAPTELDGSAKLEAMALFSGFVCQFAEWEHGGVSPGQDRLQAQRELAEYLGRAALTGQYPHLAANLAGRAAPADLDQLFARSLRRILTAMLTPVN